jgi:hypothetical protein
MPTPELMITVRYSCSLCGLLRVPCRVPARGEENVVLWMEGVVLRLSDDHARRSPHCHPDKLTEVMIPMSGAEKVGGAPVQ